MTKQRTKRQPPRYPVARTWTQFMAMLCIVLFGVAYYVSQGSPQRVEFISNGYAERQVLDTVRGKVLAVTAKAKESKLAYAALNRAYRMYVNREAEKTGDTNAIVYPENVQELENAMLAKAEATAVAMLTRMKDPNCPCRDLSSAELREPLSIFKLRPNLASVELLTKRAYLKKVHELQDRVKTIVMFAALIAVLILTATMLKASAARHLLLPSVIMTTTMSLLVVLIIFSPLYLTKVLDSWVINAVLLIPVLLCLDILLNQTLVTSWLINTLGPTPDHTPQPIVDANSTDTVVKTNDSTTSVADAIEGTVTVLDGLEVVVEVGAATVEVVGNVAGGLVDIISGLDISFSFDFCFFP